jgi:hypothetical protein
VRTFLLGDVRSLDTEVMSIRPTDPGDKRLPVVRPVVSITPRILVDSLEAGFVTTGIDGAATDWEDDEKAKHPQAAVYHAFNIQLRRRFLEFEGKRLCRTVAHACAIARRSSQEGALKSGREALAMPHSMRRIAGKEIRGASSIACARKFE